MYIYIFIILIIVLFFMLNSGKGTYEKYTDLFDFTKGQKDIKKFTDGLFTGTVLGFDAKIPGQKPCSNWDSRYRDDATSCWLDTYGRGAGRIPDVNCPSSTPNKQGIGKAVWCDNGPRLDFWNLKIGDANITCNKNEEMNGGLCYPKCKSGYHAVGCCLCEPDEGAGIKVNAFDRYLCPPSGNKDYVKLNGALCYRDLQSVQGYKYIMSTDAGGNDITHLENASLNSCKIECDNRATCKGFNFSADSYPNKPGTCWIKNNVSNKAATNSWNLFEKV